jgi:WXXGXW repeat (2 copies)
MRLARVLIPALLALAPVGMPSMASAQLGISINITIAPPVLPVYDQPPIPADGYIWVPGYWAWGDDGYYWVPGTWVEPPEAGLLWTPGYWDWNDGVYVFHDGYWGPHVGFYGGIDYGFGYGGVGYEGCFWDHGALHYNRVANNFGGVHITNVYNKTIVKNINVTKVSFRGGAGGTRAQPTAAEREAERDRHRPPTEMQNHHREAARANPTLHASANHGKPPIAATARPGQFSGHGVVGAHDIKGSPAGGQAERHEGDRPGPGPGRNQDARTGHEPHPPAARPTKQAAPAHPPAPHPARVAPPHPQRVAAPPHPQRAAAPPHPPAPRPARVAAPRPHPPAPHPAPHPVVHAAPHPAPHPAPTKH